MTADTILDITRQALLVVLWVTLPVVLIGTVVALVVAVLQAVTQIQDQSIGTSTRLIAVLVSLVLLGGWLGGEVMRFAQRALQTMLTFL
ncbi:type III secretion protein S [Cupriavidus sp. OV038]|jgi:type III secretion protein S|uniref:flagellar biosynthetic protein FliQ n=1 Tax=unclassified Cupriavidus TaxID=2640874 RepID=UPI0008EFC1B5|nr:MULTISPECIES: flagellar biosynthetic protein FliQ [unclassified Cupriavidus]SFD02458.1 type III secretion protein S [Cupriavidus sp. OV038]SFP67827.1 type III secretion protein S [Cupriavidus sp. OV096]